MNHRPPAHTTFLVVYPLRSQNSDQVAANSTTVTSNTVTLKPRALVDAHQLWISSSGQVAIRRFIAQPQL